MNLLTIARQSPYIASLLDLVKVEVEVRHDEEDEE